MKKLSQPYIAEMYPLHHLQINYMFRTLYAFCLISLFTSDLFAQVTPAENKELNYRIIGFTVIPRRDVLDYTLEIASGHFNSDDSFRKAICVTQNSKTHKILAEVPDFGRNYTWQVTFHFSGTPPVKSRLRHFSTGIVNEVDQNISRLRVDKPALKYKDAYIFLDGQKALYDMNGKPVWYLPKVDGANHSPRDMKLTSRGTITFISDKPYEINYDGEVLWKAPKKVTVSGGNEEWYHHDFTRLSNGHYMVLGTEKIQLPRQYKALISSAKGNEVPIDEDVNNNLAKFGTIIEYDKNGNVLWSWKSADYFMQPAVLAMLSNNINIFDVHQNAFYFDEKEKNIYVSFKGINSILKVSYPGGLVVDSYGDLPLAAPARKGERLFCGQHSVSRSPSKQGIVFIYNNNSCNDGPPKVKMLQEPKSAGERLKIVWEYQCGTDGNNAKKFLSGGNVNSLPDGSMLVCMGGEYSKVFILSEDKKILWSALPERDQGRPQWDVMAQYRASLVDSRQKMHDLVWQKARSNRIALK